jgi:hypothetical protein
VKDYANIIAAVILSAALLTSAWLVSLNGRYLSTGTPISIIDTRTGTVCTGVNSERSRCRNPRLPPQ